FTPAARTATRTSPRPGTGSGRSPRRGTGGAPGSTGRTARTRAARLRLVGRHRPHLGHRRGVGLAEGGARLHLGRRLLRAGLDPGVLAGQDALADLVLQGVVVRPQGAEEPADAAPRVAAEKVGELARAGGVEVAVVFERLRARHRGGHGEE